MTDKTIKLSATARAMLMQPVAREDRLVPPPKLPAAAARQVVRSLISNGLIEEIASTSAEPELVWRTADDDTPLILHATDAGVAAVTEGVGSPVAEQPTLENDAGTTAPTPRRMEQRQAAEAVVASWEALDGQTAPDAVLAPMQALQAALRPAMACTVRPIGQQRDGTKQMQVLAMLRRPEGATVAQIVEAMAWQAHTVRGFFVGLHKRLGISVTGERVPASEPGAKAQTVYRIVEAG